MSDVSIIDLLVESVNQSLLYRLHDSVDTTDPSRAYQVRIGLLQDDPTHGVNILTHANDPDDVKGWLHAVVSGPGADLRTNLSNIPYEIGGGELWFRRFTTELYIFCVPNASRDDSRREANVVLRRAEDAIRHADIGVGPDSWNEYGLAMYVATSVNTEGGGPGQFIYHARVQFQILTGQS